MFVKQVVREKREQGSGAAARSEKRVGKRSLLPLPLLAQRAAQLPQSIAPAGAAWLQRAAGNRAVGRLVVQPKLTLGPAGDQYEREADAVARQVVRHITADRPATQRQADEEEDLQMKPAPGVTAVQRQEGEEEEELQMKPLPAIFPLQRQEAEEEELQMKGAGTLAGGGELSPEMEREIQRARSGGRPLPGETRAKMEQAFNADFSGVKVHTGGQADTLNRSLQARAFTTGQDIFFRSGEYNPDSTAGWEILAHELTHVVQQNPGRVSRKTYYIGEPNTPVFDYSNQSKEVVRHKRKATLPLNEEVDGEPQSEYHAIGDGKNEYKKLTFTLDGVKRKGVVHEGKLRDNKKTRRWDKVEGVAELLDVGESGVSSRAGGLDKGELREADSYGYLVDKEKNAETAAWREKHAEEVAAGGAETVSNIIHIATILRQWKKRNKLERFSDVTDVAHLGVKTVAAVTKVVDSSSKLDPKHRSGLGDNVPVTEGGRSSAAPTGSYKTTQSDLAAKVTGNAADFMGLLVDAKEIFFKGVNLWETWKKQRKKKNTASKGDVARAGIEMGLTLLTTMKDVVSAARNLLFTLENAWLSGGVATAIPGLGIAISGLKIIVSMWNVIKAARRRARMRQLKRAWKEGFNAADHKEVARIKQKIEKRKNKMSRKDKKHLELIAEYEMQKELQYINRKRINRQILHISTAVASIAGDIASLTGVGATAGVGLKALASIGELGAKGLRALKQWGRNRAAKEASWKITRQIFNKDKSSKAKLAKYEMIANRIYDMVISLAGSVANLENGTVPYDHPQFKRIRDYIRAVGLSWKVWLHITSENPDAGHTAILQGLAERE